MVSILFGLSGWRADCLDGKLSGGLAVCIVICPSSHLFDWNSVCHAVFLLFFLMFGLSDCRESQ